MVEQVKTTLPSQIADLVSVADLFDQFIDASTMQEVLSLHHRILNYSDLSPCDFSFFYPRFKSVILGDRQRTNWRAKAVFSKVDKKAAHRWYSSNKSHVPIEISASDMKNEKIGTHSDENISPIPNRHSNNALHGHNCLIIGGGPAGLRTAIELQLLGAKRVVVVEKRDSFSRNNVVHLWPFVIDDLKSLGAKKFYGKFCAGSIDHISIRQLQLMLLKVCLLVGCDFRDSCSYLFICPSGNDAGHKEDKRQSSENNITSEASDRNENNSQLCKINPIDRSSVCEFFKVSDQLDGQASEAHNSGFENNFSGSKVQEVDQTSISLGTTPMQSKKLRTGRITQRRGVRVHFESRYRLQEIELHSIDWDIIIGADGRHNTLDKLFPRKEFRCKLAIAITANFINRQTPAETAVPEISGLSFIYNQNMFNALSHDTNIDLENICYYKDDTHYFVMTAKKKSLLERGVLKKDCSMIQELLSDDNVNRDALLKYAKDAAHWTTGLEPLDFAINHHGQEDCAMFDFTTMCAALNSCKALKTPGEGLALFGLVGDSLLEPFWPTGSGCARGFLSSFDAAWMCRQWAVHKCAEIDQVSSSKPLRTRNSGNKHDSMRKPDWIPYNRMALSVIAERESIYRVLAQTTSENLQQNYSHWTLNPHTRYPNLNRHLIMPAQVEHLVLDSHLGDLSMDSARVSTNFKSTQEHKIKSPTYSSSRKSLKKLKSAGSSPVTSQRYLDKTSKSSKSLYWEFEKLSGSSTDDNEEYLHCMNTLRARRDLYTSRDRISTEIECLPSARNLSSIEAKRARDIDECLRYRRQKAQLEFVKDHLGQHVNDGVTNNRNSGLLSSGNAAVFRELRRWKDHRGNAKSNRTSLDLDQPLFLLNSMRRCASFAERVKSFEGKFDTNGSHKGAASRTHIDDVRNLPQFATLQRLLTPQQSESGQSQLKPKKSKIPIMKLTKDDWNVKCWEERLAAYERRAELRSKIGSSKSLDKESSYKLPDESRVRNKPERQVDVFRDRIKEMANKLDRQQEEIQVGLNYKRDRPPRLRDTQVQNPSVRSGWVSHLREELVRTSESARNPKNHLNLGRPIKKLFDEDDDDGGIDVDKHYDHLCVNKSVRKYAQRNGYNSHLARKKFDSENSIVLNRTISAEHKQAYMDAQTSRSPSRSSDISDNSSGVAHTLRSSSSTSNESEAKCFRCKSLISPADRISVGESALHRSCLACAGCSITLRTLEVKFYLNQINADEHKSYALDFLCEICQASNMSYSPADFEGPAMSRIPVRSRDNFLNEKVDYNELYKNIMDEKIRTPEQKLASQSSVDTKNESSPERFTITESISPSPVRFTLPMTFISGEDEATSKFTIAASKVVDGSETVTLSLPFSDSKHLDPSSRDHTKPNKLEITSKEDAMKDPKSQSHDVDSNSSADDDFANVTEFYEDSSSLDSPPDIYTDACENTDVEREDSEKSGNECD